MSAETAALREQLGQLSEANWQPVNALTRAKNEEALHHAQTRASMVDLFKNNPLWQSKQARTPIPNPQPIYRVVLGVTCL